LNVTAERIPDSQVLLTIEVDPERVERSMDQAYRRVLPRVRVPGFRPGKAPRRILERHVGRETLLHEALDRLVPEVVNEAIKDQDLQVVDEPDLEISSLEPVVIKATVPIRPTIDLGDYRTLRLEMEPVTVDEAQVEQTIDELRHRYATIEPVDRPIQEGDRIRASVTATSDGRPFVEQEDAELTVTPEGLAALPGLYDRLLGMSKGESAEFDAALPDDYRRPDLAGQPVHYQVTILDVLQEVLPDLNDEFARGVGEGFASMEALRERIRSDLRTRAEDAARRNLQERAVEALTAQATVEYPPQLVEREIDHMLRDITQPAGGDRRALERALQQAGRSEAELRAELRPGAVDRVKRTLVLSRLAELEGIEVTEADVEQELNNLAGDSPQASQIRQIFDTPSGREWIERQVRSRRTLDRLTDIVTGQAPAAETVEEPAPPPAVEGVEGVEAPDREARDSGEEAGEPEGAGTAE
jgi:trigger factor